MKKNISMLILFPLLTILISCINAEPNNRKTISTPVENKSVDNIYESQKYKNRTQITFTEMQEDLETFIYLLETSYIGYDEVLERGLDSNVQYQKVLGHFENQKTIEIKDFLNILHEAFEEYIQDNHASLTYFNNNEQLNFINEGKVYFSDLYVQKSAERYYVCESNLEELKTGARYNSDIEFLFLYPAKGKDVYRVGCVSTKEPESLKLEFDNQFYDIPVVECKEAKGNENFSYFDLELNKSVYIKLNRCCFDNDKELKALHKFAESYKSLIDKDFIIIDVRGNYGGDDYYMLHFLCGLYDDNKSDIDFGTGTRWLYSPASVKSLKTILPYLTDVNNPAIKKMLKEISVYEKQLKKNSQKIIVNKNSEKSEIGIPEFKGKLIVLTDKIAASSGEDVIAYGNALFGKTGQIIQIGQNTSGCQLYGNVCRYVLKNSGIEVHLAVTDFSDVSKLAPNFHGEGNGYYPDYWASNEDINDAIFAITGDKEMYEVLNNIF